jgi:hypothetical protein
MHMGHDPYLQTPRPQHRRTGLDLFGGHWAGRCHQGDEVSVV